MDRRTEGTDEERSLIWCRQKTATIKDRDRQSSMLLGRRLGFRGSVGEKKQHGKPTVVLYLHVCSACLLSFLKLFHTTRGSGTKDRL